MGVVSGIPTLPTHPACTTPGTPPPARTVSTSVGAVLGVSATGSLGRPKEILGVDNAQLHMVYRSVPHGCLTHGPAVSLSPPVGPCCSLHRARVVQHLHPVSSIQYPVSSISISIQYPVSSIQYQYQSQYFSVFLSISQLFD